MKSRGDADPAPRTRPVTSNPGDSVKHIVTAAFAAAILLASATTGAAQQGRSRHETEAQLRRQARIPEAQARRTALDRIPRGRVRSHELEREHGRLIYSYDIAVPGRSGIEEVTVDALTGRVVTVEHETPAAERREAREEARAHPGNR
jgi:uncharacterized membrane protein YkoI